jgi:hypothetical protein
MMSAADVNTTAAESTVAVAKEDVAAAESKVAAAESKVAAAKEDVAAAESKVAAAESKVAAAESKVAAAKKDVAAAKKDVAAAKASSDAAAISTAQTLLRLAVSALESAVQGVQSAQQGVQSAQRGVQSAQRGVESAQEILSAMRHSAAQVLSTPPSSDLTLQALSLDPRSSQSLQQCVNWTSVKKQHGDCGAQGAFCLFQHDMVDFEDVDGMSALLCDVSAYTKNATVSRRWDAAVAQADELLRTGDHPHGVKARVSTATDSSAATVTASSWDIIPSVIHQLRDEEKSFDTVIDWHFSCLTQWAALKDMLMSRSAVVPEVTFDINLMVFFNNILVRMAYLPEWREKKAMSSQQQRDSDTKTKKIDCLVISPRDRAEVFLFESSLSVSNRTLHAQQDRMKIAHALGCATRAVLQNDPSACFGSYGMHLHEQEKGNVRLVGYQCVLNASHRCWELHTLFDVRVPLGLSCGKDVDDALLVLRNIYAIASMIVLQESTRGQSKPSVSSIKTQVGGSNQSSNQRDEKKRDDDDDPSAGDDKPPPPPPPLNFDTTPTKRSLQAAIATTYDLQSWNDDGSWLVQGSRSHVIPAVCTTSRRPVVLKIQSRSEHTRELHVLQRLRAIDGIVQVLDFFECIDGFVLVLPRLAPIDFSNLRSSSDTQIFQFVCDAVSVVMAIHSRGVAHGDLKPSAFMLDRCTSAVILLDFNLSCLSTERLNGRLSGTAGWVFDDAPAIVGSDIDRIGLAGIIGWLLGVEGFGDADSNFVDAVTSIKRRLTIRSYSVERRCLLRVVESLLCTRVPLSDLLARVQSSVVACTKITALRALAPVRDAASHDKENLPTVRTSSDSADASVVKTPQVEAVPVEAVQLRR